MRRGESRRGSISGAVQLECLESPDGGPENLLLELIHPWSGARGAASEQGLHRAGPSLHQNEAHLAAINGSPLLCAPLTAHHRTGQAKGRMASRRIERISAERLLDDRHERLIGFERDFGRRRLAERVDGKERK